MLAERQIHALFRHKTRCIVSECRRPPFLSGRQEYIYIHSWIKSIKEKGFRSSVPTHCTSCSELVSKTDMEGCFLGLLA